MTGLRTGNRAILLFCSLTSLPCRNFSCTAPLSEIDLRVSGTIEDDGESCLQVDFANRYVGGAVLTHGNTQEEIRFLINTGARKLRPVEMFYPQKISKPDGP
jgi:hypothetical protein